jgi:hypothetical protein
MILCIDMLHVRDEADEIPWSCASTYTTEKEKAWSESSCLDR